MRFGPMQTADAAGAILAHSLRLGRRVLKKGRVLTAEDTAQLIQAGIAEVTVAVPGPGDVAEDEAALRLAESLVPDPAAAGLRLSDPVAGRVNLNATGPGIVAVDAAAVLKLNLVHPEITLATLAQHTRVTAGLLVGTVKIISYAVPEAQLAQACDAARGVLRVRPVVRRTAGLILTEVPGQKPSLNEKGRAAVEGRLANLGIDLQSVVTVGHDIGEIARALASLPGEIALVLTGSATSDLHDTGPEALRRAGGEVARFGMPVDPGNLLFHGRQGGRVVIGLPGCARAPALNGADWVLERLACGLDLSDEDFAAMGVGGLLKEIPSRPQPRER